MKKFLTIISLSFVLYSMSFAQISQVAYKQHKEDAPCQIVSKKEACLILLASTASIIALAYAGYKLNDRLILVGTAPVFKLAYDASKIILGFEKKQECTVPNQ